MIFVPILLAIAFAAVLGVVLLRRAGGGRFPWLQFYLKGRESGFVLREVNLLRRVAVTAKLENPTALFWSIKQLDRSIKGIIINYRAQSREEDPEYNHLLAKLFELRRRVEFDQPKYKLGIKSSRRLLPKQNLRITLPGIGPFASMIVENLPRYMAVSHPQGPKLPDGFSWKNQKVGVYFWRAEDAGYFFQTKVQDDFIEKNYPILHVLHSDNLIRTQKRNSMRVEADMSGELFPLKSIDQASELPEKTPGLRCKLMDLSEGGAAILVGGKARAGMPLKVQFEVGRKPLVMCGVVKGINFDQKKNRSLLHLQAAPLSVTERNRLLTYVYNLFGERETVTAPRKPESRAGEKSAAGIVLKAAPSSTEAAPEETSEAAKG